MTMNSSYRRNNYNSCRWKPTEALMENPRIKLAAMLPSTATLLQDLEPVMNQMREKQRGMLASGLTKVRVQARRNTNLEDDAE